MAGADSPRQLVTLNTASQQLDTPVETLRHWVRQGRLAKFKLGRRVLLDQAEIDSLIEQSRTPAA